MSNGFAYYLCTAAVASNSAEGNNIEKVVEAAFMQSTEYTSLKFFRY